MMEVRMVQQMSGPRPDGTDWPDYNEKLTVSDAEGADLCAAGIAVPVVEERSEKATVQREKPVETRAPDPAVAQAEAQRKAEEEAAAKGKAAEEQRKAEEEAARRPVKTR